MTYRVLIVLALLGFLVLSSPLSAGSAVCDARVNNTVAKLLECVTVDGVRQHQAAFQTHADANGGNRFSGFPGYDASVDYVVALMEGAGYVVTVQPFDYTAFTPQGRPSWRRHLPQRSPTWRERTSSSLTRASPATSRPR